MKTILPIFMGWDPRETAAYDVAYWSIKRRTSFDVIISPLVLSNLESIIHRPIERRDGKLWCPISNAPMATEFAISRFCVPFIQQSGWALFCDSDVLCMEDISKLFSLADNQYAVMVVKHKHEPTSLTKMDGQIQTFYKRKNWSSVVLWNCNHPSNKKFTIQDLNTRPGRDLHAFYWLEDNEIGELPNKWNHLVSVNPTKNIQEGIYHYTLGGPWFEGWKSVEEDELWSEEYSFIANNKY